MTTLYHHHTKPFQTVKNSVKFLIHVQGYVSSHASYHITVTLGL